MIDYIDNETERIFIIPDIELADIISDLDKMVIRFIEKEERDVVFDMSNIRQMDSKTLAEFVRVKKMVVKMGKNFTLINPGDKVHKVISISGLEKFLLEQDQSEKAQSE
jgi:anti-anti-sigma factor